MLNGPWRRLLTNYDLLLLKTKTTYFLERDRIGRFRKILHNYFTGREYVGYI